MTPGVGGVIGRAIGVEALALSYSSYTPKDARAPAAGGGIVKATYAPSTFLYGQNGMNTALCG
tara:strand:- start:1 stop:189 length:189 start_codon:yes stop_codon:yes gene_type:complete